MLKYTKNDHHLALSTASISIAINLASIDFFYYFLFKIGWMAMFHRFLLLGVVILDVNC